MFTTTLCRSCTAIVTVPAAALTARPCRCRGCGAVVTHEPWEPEPTAQVLAFPAREMRPARAA
ncbi:hypothetical protein LWC35_00880 [Pseudonocardia kujensis]|uniref:hypothetical protein n=1 Tax=Pseudonocardia kujensis TaxID=1128675 RepID=UPI001E2A7751|nr:hypothetical protein [Pseudonocardia kujensis]MCE0761476.1 hypothetical protein [Pseudonocardia kujensis]